MNSSPSTPNGPHDARVLVAGGGIAAVEALLALRALAPEALRIELVSSSRELVYQPLAVGEPFGIARAVDFDLAGIAEGSGASLTAGTIASVDPERRTVATREGAELSYDFLILALGASPREWLPGSVHFGGVDQVGELVEVLSAIEAGDVRRLAFVVPSGPSWSLPLYELALLTERWLEARGARRTVELTVVTSEDGPLAAFGPRASAAVAALLDERGIALHAGAHVAKVDADGIELVPAGHVEADRVVSLPRAVGPAIDGLPSDSQGFLEVDERCRVRGIASVYAAGDITDFPIKQGGIATQQADAAAASIAAATGAELEPKPFRPVLRAVLLTGEEPEYLHAALSGGHGEASGPSAGPLWWPPGKVAGRYLGPYLAALADEELRPPGR